MRSHSYVFKSLAIFKQLALSAFYIPYMLVNISAQSYEPIGTSQS